MDPVSVGVIGVVLLVLCFLLRVPVAFSMAFCRIRRLFLPEFFECRSQSSGQGLFRAILQLPYQCDPNVCADGILCFCIRNWEKTLRCRLYGFGGSPRGLAMATVVACGFFAAICGSTAATAATMGRSHFRRMKRYHYDDSFATGCVASAGTLGILIPPSTIFLVYGIMTEQSVGKLFVAGIVPGIILTFLFILTVAFLCWRNPSCAPAGASTDFKQKRKAILGMIEALILFGLVIGGLFFGWFTPTQAGGIGAAGALVIGLARRELNWRGFIECTRDGLRTSCMVLCIIAGATVFGHFMAVSTIPFILADWVAELPLPKTAIMGVIVFMYLIGGCFMDSMALIVLTVPSSSRWWSALDLIPYGSVSSSCW